MFGLGIQCWWTDWTLRRIFCRGATVNCRECWTASRWTGSPDLERGLTSRSLWSSLETGAHWWLSGHAVAPVREYLHGSASRLSRRAASHLAALTALRSGVTAWWTRKVMLPIWRVDKWIGRLACWPQIADTSRQVDASGQVDIRHRRLWTLSTLYFWWLNGRIPASPSWSVELPCGGWEWKGRSPDEDLLSSSAPERVGCSTRGNSCWWPALRPPSTARCPRPAGGLAGCFWSGSWCIDGWAEVSDGK